MSGPMGQGSTHFPDGHEREVDEVERPLRMTLPQQRPFELHPDLQRSIQRTWGRIYSEGLTLDAWNAMIREINCALTVERNESYVRGMHDEHNEPLGDRLPPLPAPRS